MTEMATANTIDRNLTRRARRVNAGVLLLIATAVLLSLKHGVVQLSWAELAGASCGEAASDVVMLLTQLRLPRIVMAVLVGIGLATSGAVLQGVTRNDLATPGLLGVMTGGNLAVTLTVFLSTGILGAMVLPVVSFVGAMLTVALVFALASDRAGMSPTRLLLTGLAVSTAVGALSSVVSMRLPIWAFDFVTAWLSSSLARATWSYNMTLLPWIAILFPIALVQASRLNALSLGEEPAVGLGVRLNVSRYLLVALAVAMASSCVAVGGSITFLGLLAPHIARRLVGLDYRRVIPTAALIGIVLLVVADLAGRTLFGPAELPAGVIVTAIGGPYFLYLMIRS